MDLKIIGPIKKPLKEFESPDEFNLYYHKHKEEMDSETTHSLNKKFKIDGFRITKIKGVLCLKKDVQKDVHKMKSLMFLMVLQKNELKLKFNYSCHFYFYFYTPKI